MVTAYIRSLHGLHFKNTLIRGNIACSIQPFVLALFLALLLTSLDVPAQCATDSSVRYIDFKNGSDESAGTRNAPWKHHPWDPEAHGQPKSTCGVLTYVFKKGVTYRGFLNATESGSIGAPIRLTTTPDWGQGEAVLAGSQTYVDGWQRCRSNAVDKLPVNSKSKTWCRNIEGSEPRALWEKTETGVIRIPIARTPNWKIVVPDNPRSEWSEFTDVLVELSVYVDRTNGFSVGEKVTTIPRRKVLPSLAGQRDPELKIIGISDKELRIEAVNRYEEFLKLGHSVTNGKVAVAINKISDTHSIIRRLVDKKNLALSRQDAYVGATVWAERRSMPKADAAIVTDFNPSDHSFKTNFHRGIGGGPMPYDRYYLEGLLEFLDSTGEYVFLPSGKNSGMLVVRLPNDRDPNNTIIEAASRPVILKIQNQSNIEISGLAFRFSNQIATGTTEAMVRGRDR